MKLITLFFLATLSGCSLQPQDSPHARNTTLIIERDGVKLYRTYDTDTGADVYFTTSGNVQWNRSNGKSTVRENVGGQ